jgi:hypothetical protein
MENQTGLRTLPLVMRPFQVQTRPPEDPPRDFVEFSMSLALKSAACLPIVGGIQPTLTNGA